MPRRGSRAAPPTELVRHEWASRIEAEYRSAALTQETTLWLLQVGASPDLVRAGNRIVDDELVHAALSQKVWLAAGGSGLPLLDRSTLAIGRAHDALELDLCSAIVRYFCLGETVAVRLFANLRAGTAVGVARRALDRILKDEVRHRDFGWTCLEWLLAGPLAAELRALIRARLPAWIRELERSYGDDLDRGIPSVTPGERAWGVAPWPEYAAILKKAYSGDYRRRFARLDVDFDAAVAALSPRPAPSA